MLHLDYCQICPLTILGTFESEESDSDSDSDSNK